VKNHENTTTPSPILIKSQPFSDAASFFQVSNKRIGNLNDHDSMPSVLEPLPAESLGDSSLGPWPANADVFAALLAGPNRAYSHEFHGLSIAFVKIARQ